MKPIFSKDQIVIHRMGTGVIQNISQISIQGNPVQCYDILITKKPSSCLLRIPCNKSHLLRSLVTTDKINAFFAKLLSPPIEGEFEIFHIRKWSQRWRKSRTILGSADFDLIAQVYHEYLYLPSMTEAEQEVIKQMQEFLIQEIAGVRHISQQAARKQLEAAILLVHTTKEGEDCNDTTEE